MFRETVSYLWKFGALTVNDCSYSETTLAGTFRETRGTVALTPVPLEFSEPVKNRPMSLSVILFKVFQFQAQTITLYLSSLHWSDWILSAFFVCQNVPS